MATVLASLRAASHQRTSTRCVRATACYITTTLKATDICASPTVATASLERFARVVESAQVHFYGHRPEEVGVGFGYAKAATGKDISMVVEK